MTELEKLQKALASRPGAHTNAQAVTIRDHISRDHTFRDPTRDRHGHMRKGYSGNPEGMRPLPALRLTRAEFLAQLTGPDAHAIYAAFMQLIEERHPNVVLRGMEYVLGKPKEQIEISAAPAVPLLDYSKLTPEQRLQLEALMVMASPLNRPSEQVVDAVATEVEE